MISHSLNVQKHFLPLDLFFFRPLQIVFTYTSTYPISRLFPLFFLLRCVFSEEVKAASDLAAAEAKKKKKINYSSEALRFWNFHERLRVAYLISQPLRNRSDIRGIISLSSKAAINASKLSSRPSKLTDLIPLEIHVDNLKLNDVNSARKKQGRGNGVQAAEGNDASRSREQLPGDISTHKSKRPGIESMQQPSKLSPLPVNQGQSMCGTSVLANDPLAALSLKYASDTSLMGHFVGFGGTARTDVGRPMLPSPSIIEDMEKIFECFPLLLPTPRVLDPSEGMFWGSHCMLEFSLQRIPVADFICIDSSFLMKSLKQNLLDIDGDKKNPLTYLATSTAKTPFDIAIEEINMQKQLIEAAEAEVEFAASGGFSRPKSNQKKKPKPKRDLFAEQGLGTHMFRLPSPNNNSKSKESIRPGTGSRSKNMKLKNKVVLVSVPTPKVKPPKLSLLDRLRVAAEEAHCEAALTDVQQQVLEKRQHLKHQAIERRYDTSSPLGKHAHVVPTLTSASTTAGYHSSHSKYHSVH